jgi:formylglycine-generating enzyme required for sulfatase activity
MESNSSMRHRTLSSVATFLAAFLAAAFFSATERATAVTIKTVPVGNPGNPADTRYDATGFGSVAYHYRIGKYEVTNAQYVEFLNGVDPTGSNTLALYGSNMASDSNGGINFNGSAANGSKYEIKPGRDNNPVIYIDWYDTIRFANWMHNGSGSGDTENGAYTLLGGTPTPSNGNSITRNAGAKWWLPSEDEWYKAAYHKNDGATANYWDYPTSTNATPYSDQPPGTDAPNASNTANLLRDDGVANGYDDGHAVTGSPARVMGQNYLTDVGAYTLSVSSYGTFDQAGNVWEWNEALVPIGIVDRVVRGGGWHAGGPLDMETPHASVRCCESFFPRGLTVQIGFRVATFIPEPSTLCLASLFTLVLAWRRKTARA